HSTTILFVHARCTSCCLSFFFPRAGVHRDLHSFPTRRSSDLTRSRLSHSRAAQASRCPPRSGRPTDFTNRKSPVRASASIWVDRDRKSTRLNSSHVSISYAVFCLKKKKKTWLDTSIYRSVHAA